MNKIVDIKDGDKFDIYMGRENTYLNLPKSKWANPHKLERESDRLDCLEKFYNYAVQQDHLIKDLHELDDKILGCYCGKKLCHSLVWLYLREKQKRNIPWQMTFCEETKSLLLFFMTSSFFE